MRHDECEKDNHVPRMEEILKDDAPWCRCGMYVLKQVRWHEDEVKPKRDVDLVNHPPHYKAGNIEVIDFLEDQKLGGHEWNVVKYVCRARHKGNELQDLKKAQWYLDRKIKALEGKV